MQTIRQIVWIVYFDTACAAYHHFLPKLTAAFIGEDEISDDASSKLKQIRRQY